MKHCSDAVLVLFFVSFPRRSWATIAVTTLQPNSHRHVSASLTLFYTILARHWQQFHGSDTLFFFCLQSFGVVNKERVNSVSPHIIHQRFEK